MDQSIDQVLPQVVQDLLLPLSVELASADISTLRLVDSALPNLLRVTVRTRLNKCAMVNRLPPEVLSAIFNFLRAESFDYNDTHGCHPVALRPDNRSLIAITHVCRRWRNVALDYAQLWTNVSTSCVLAPEFFERSRGMPLTVFVSLIQGRPPPVPKQVFLDQHPRIRALHIDLECSMQIHHWRKHLRSLAKSLESLTIVNHGRRIRARANPPRVMPFFGTERPTSLKLLSISSVTVLMPTDDFPVLEHACLSMPDSLLFPVDSLMLLSNAPRLRTFYLHLRYAAGHSHFHEFPNLPRIDLPMMRHLCIALPQIRPRYQPGDDHLGAVRTVLTNVNLPTTAIVSIQETSWVDKGSYMPDLYLVPSAGPAAESALIIDSRGTTFTVRGSPTTSFQYPANITPKKIQSRTYGVRHSARTKAALATVCALRIHSNPRWLRASPRSFCLHTLATLVPRLVVLVLRDYTGEMAAHLARMLVPRGAGPVPCPSLASVTYITLGRACQCPVREGRFVLAPDSPLSSPDASKAKATATLNSILAATAARAGALHRRLPRLVFCYPSAPREYILENAHGIERVEVQRADAWAAPDPDGVLERWADSKGRYRCCCSVAAGGGGPGPAQNAHRQARAARRAQAAARTPGLEEEYGAVWAAERARVEAGKARGQEGTPYTASLLGSESKSETEPESECKPEPSAGLTDMPGMRMAGEFVLHAHPSPNHTSANTGASVHADGLDRDNGAVAMSATELAYFDLVLCFLSLWFVQLVIGY